MLKKTSIFQRLLCILPPPLEQTLQKLSKRVDTGKSIFHQQMKKENKTYLYSIEEGRKILATQKYNVALEIFSYLVKENPNSRWALHGLGDAYQFMSCYKEALVNYQQAYELSLKQPQIDSTIKEKGLHLAGMANAYMGLGHIEKANNIWKQVAECDHSLIWMKENAQINK